MNSYYMLIIDICRLFVVKFSSFLYTGNLNNQVITTIIYHMQGFSLSGTISVRDNNLM